MKKLNDVLTVMIATLVTPLAYASVIIPMHLTDATGKGKDIGTVVAEDSAYGLLLTPNLHDLPAGVHGFHVHETPACDHQGMAAGGHLDPDHTMQHKGPYDGTGHLGDLPVLVVNAQGQANLPLLAPRLKLSDLQGRALMIHAGGDNYSDKPEKLGGGGSRIACGVVPS
jgi:Cu-Zn family superoxide dismutase